MAFIKQVPLLLFIFVIYNVVVLSGADTLHAGLFHVTLLSGVSWPFTTSDLLLALALLALCGEVIKSTRSTNASVLDHALSMLLFVACLVEFIAYSAAGTSTFFLITLMSFVDVLAGFTVTIAAARRDIEHG